MDQGYGCTCNKCGYSFSANLGVGLLFPITKFWTPDLFLSDITEENYLDLIAKCREYGYSEETIWNINACLRKLINIAYKNRYLKENPMDFWDSPRINPKNKRQIIPQEDYVKIDRFFLRMNYGDWARIIIRSIVFGMLAILYRDEDWRGTGPTVG